MNGKLRNLGGWAAVALVAGLANAGAALAAPPSAFVAVGSAISYATADAPEQTTPLKFFFQGGKVRIELKPAGGSPSVMIARRGTGKVTMLDPEQKVAFVAPVQGMDAQAGMPSMDQLLDLPGWKSELQKTGKHLPGRETIGTERCSIWEQTRGKTHFKVWFSDALELPMQVEGRVDGKPRFRFTMARVTTGPQSASLFTVPAGYQTTEMDGAALQRQVQ